MPRKIREMLEKFGAENTESIVNDFYCGNIIQYENIIDLAKITGYIKLEKRRLITAIFTADSNNPNDGVTTFRRFYKNSKELCKIANASELELIGIAVINRKVELFLKRNGFESEEMLIPDEFGNDGTTLCYYKIIKVR